MAAQEEAERMRVGYIGTEHILLGLLRVDSAAASRVLARFDVSIGRVRKAIANRRPERPRVEQAIPTSRVKRIIEISFIEATRLGHESVDTGHLLMGVVMEGEGIAALVLQDFGATAERVVAELERELGAPPSGQGRRARPGRRFRAVTFNALTRPPRSAPFATSWYPSGWSWAMR